MKPIIDRSELFNVLIPELASHYSRKHCNLSFLKLADRIRSVHDANAGDYLLRFLEKLRERAICIALPCDEYSSDLVLLLSQALALYKKECSNKVPAHLIRDAEIKHRDNENWNRDTNTRLSKLWDLDPIMVRARHKCYQALGLLARVYDDIWDGLSLGPGSVYSSAERSLFSKLTSEQTISVNALPLLQVFIESSPALVKAWADSGVELEVVAGNKLSYVPKDVKKCRQIAIEPSINVMLQLGIGKVLTRICKGLGQDITNQERNRELALRGSISGDFATIDLSDASSLISNELVRFLVPSDWYALMNSARSSHTRDKEKWESFSSQGNAFTFPLETIIFTVLAESAAEVSKSPAVLGRRLVSVYGDDIICHKLAYALVCETLTRAGLRVNAEKSFNEGFFRESCGLDALGGYNVRPIFYKEDAVQPSDVAKIHNALLIRYPFLCDTISFLRNLVPKRLKGPLGVHRSEGLEYNKMFTPTYQWFIEPFPPKIQWKKSIHDTTVSFRTYHVSQEKSDEYTCHPSLLSQVIMYGGESWNDTPFLRKSTRTVNTVLSAIVLSEEHEE